jgi:Xaa-Pro aminopeptidase
VRIEDDLLITADGYKNLSAGSPRTVEAIEKMARQGSIFRKKK